MKKWLAVFFLILNFSLLLCTTANTSLVTEEEIHHVVKKSAITSNCQSAVYDVSMSIKQLSEIFNLSGQRDVNPSLTGVYVDKPTPPPDNMTI